MGRKRGSHEGSIYKRKDGRWAAAVSLPEGKRKHFYGKTRSDVAERLRLAQHAHSRGLPIGEERATVGQFLDRWLQESARATLRPRVFTSYRQIVEGHLTPSLGRTRLLRLTPNAIQAYMNRKIADGLSPYTVRNHHSILRRALRDAERWGLVPRNVARLVSPPRIPHAEVEPLTPEQARRFLTAVKGDRLEALYHAALALGLRQGEALGLSWADVDLDAGTVTVRASLQRYDGTYRRDEVKTPRSRRTIGLPEPLPGQLRMHRTRQLEERLQIGPGWIGNAWDLVFTSEAGEPLYGTKVTRDYQEQLLAAGLPPQRFHDLRHAAASFMLAQGVPLADAQRVLGHSTVAVTADVYGHIRVEATRAATERVSALLWGRS